jgi:hypothetical protein
MRETRRQVMRIIGRAGQVMGIIPRAKHDDNLNTFSRPSEKFRCLGQVMKIVGIQRAWHQINWGTCCRS